MVEDKRRFFILTLGRTGSSLLSSILSDAGANFGGLKDADWDRTGGAFEHPKLISVVRSFRKMDEISQRRPLQLLPRFKWDIARHHAKSALRDVLSDVAYVKGELEHAVHWAARLDYVPKIIVSYRRFGPLYESIGHMHPQLPHVHAEQYTKSLLNGLGLAKIYGGCVIDYDEIIDASENVWASGLAETTGLPKEKLISARSNRVDTSIGNETSSIEPFPDCVQAYEKLRKYRGENIPIARATQRVLGI